MSNEGEGEAVVYIRGDRRTHAYRIVKTLVLFLSWVCLGMFNEVVGPTLPDLKDRVGANYEEIGRVLAARSAGLFVGSLFGGLIYDRFTSKRDFILAISLVISGIVITSAPHVGSLWLMGILFHIMGHGHALQTTGGNPSTAFLWADRSSGPYNFLHSGFGVGAALAPLIAQPFISDDILANSTNQSASNAMMSFPANQTTGNSTVSTRVAKIEYPYGIVGACCFFVAICFLVFFILRRRTPEMFIPKEQTNLVKIIDPSSCAGGEMGFGFQMFALIFFFYMLLIGGERAYGKFIYVYARESSLKFDKRQATLINTMYWVSFTAARIVAFVAAKWIPVHILLFIQVIGTAITAMFLNIFPTNAIAFWVCTFGFGFFKAPLFPSMLGWINRYIHITSMVIMVVNIGSSTGGMLVQWLTGYLFEYYGPHTFLYTLITYSVLLLLSFMVMHFVGYRHGDRFSKQEAEVDDKQDVGHHNGEFSTLPEEKKMDCD